MQLDNEEQWIHKAQKGDINAFEMLIKNYEKAIYNMCLRLLCNEQEAYDAAQEVCIKIWRQLSSFKGSCKISTWIYRITTNQCIDIIRKKSKLKEVSFVQKNEQSGEEWLIEHVDEKQCMEAYIEKGELKNILLKGIGELKEEYRVILVLRDMEDYSYEAIGEILGLSLGTVKSRISRARRQLKKILSQNKEPYKSYFRQITKKEDTQ